MGIDLDRFRPIPRREARERLGLDPDGPYLLFPHDPARPLKRFDRAREAAGDVPLLQMGRVAPDEVPYWINAANAVLVPVAGRGLRAVGDRGDRLRRARVRDAGRHPPGRAARHRGRVLRAVRPRRVARRAARRTSRRPTRAWTGRRRAELFSADRMAARVVAAWRGLLAERGTATGGGRAYTRSPGRFERRAPPPMNGLLRRLTRRRAATADETPPGTPAASEPVDATVVSHEEGPALSEEERAREEELRRRRRDLPAGLDADRLESVRRRGRRAAARCAAGSASCSAAREVLLRDLGGFSYEVHRAAGAPHGGHRDIIERKAQRLAAIDEELRALEARARR